MPPQEPSVPSSEVPLSPNDTGISLPDIEPAYSRPDYEGLVQDYQQQAYQTYQSLSTLTEVAPSQSTDFDASIPMADQPEYVMPPEDERAFIAPQFDTPATDASYRRRLMLWWGMRVGAVVLLLGLLGGGAFATYKLVGPGKGDSVASKDDRSKGADGSKAPLSSWVCADNETKHPDDDTKCIGEKDALIPLETIYSCTEGFTKSGEGESTMCTKPSSDAEVLTEPLEVEYSCPADFEEAGDETACSREVSVASSIQNSCPAGYVAASGRCAKSTTAYAAYITSCTAAGWVKTSTGCSRTIAGTYTCPSGYTRSGTTCTDTIKLKADGTCKAGYKKKDGKCVRTVNATLTPCPSGYARVGTSCVATGSWTYSCPADYTQSGAGGATKCTKTTVAYANFSQQRVCPAGYALEGVTCVKTEVRAAIKSYYCPDDYTNTAGKCQQVIGAEMEIEDPTYEDGCRDGYVLTEDETQCRRQDSEAHEAELKLSCDDGWELKKTKVGARCFEKKS